MRNLAFEVEQSPDRARAAFNRVEAALNLVLPGSKTHERYVSIENVGLAVVVGRDWVGPGSYNPFDWEISDRMSFMGDNRAEHPETWAPKPVDAEMLGGDLPEGVGRFTAFALAKINGMLDHRRPSSVRADKIAIGFGRVGLAGGRRIGDDSLLSVSGLWEVHDDIVSQVYAKVFANPSSDPEDRAVDTLAGEFEDIFGRLQKLHAGVEAATLNRKAVTKLVARTHLLLEAA